MKSPMTRVQEKELGKIYQLLYYLKKFKYNSFANTSHVFCVWRRGGIDPQYATDCMVSLCLFRRDHLYKFKQLETVGLLYRQEAYIHSHGSWKHLRE